VQVDAGRTETVMQMLRETAVQILRRQRDLDQVGLMPCGGQDEVNGAIVHVILLPQAYTTCSLALPQLRWSPTKIGGEATGWAGASLTPATSKSQPKTFIRRVAYQLRAHDCLPLIKNTSK